MKYKVEIYKLKPESRKERYGWRYFEIQAVIYKRSNLYIRLSSVLCGFKKKFSKKYIETLRKSGERDDVLIFSPNSTEGGAESLKKHYDKIKTYEIP